MVYIHGLGSYADVSTGTVFYYLTIAAKDGSFEENIDITKETFDNVSKYFVQAPNVAPAGLVQDEEEKEEDSSDDFSFFQDGE